MNVELAQATSRSSGKFGDTVSVHVIESESDNSEPTSSAGVEMANHESAASGVVAAPVVAAFDEAAAMG